MNILVTRDAQGGEAWLTTDSPASHYGCPVLRIEADDVDGDFGPADMIDTSGDANRIHPERIVTAADVVAGWARSTERTPEEIEAARKFLSQWPDGPQIEPVRVRLGDLGTRHVWFTSVGHPAGCDLIADEGANESPVPEAWADLAGTVEGNKWEWDAKGKVVDERSNTVTRIVAFVPRAAADDAVGINEDDTLPLEG